MINNYEKLKKEVISEGLCTHCGTCVGLSDGSLSMKETENGPIPKAIKETFELTEMAFKACPGKGLNYPRLTSSIFDDKVSDWRLGFYKNIYIGYASNNKIRRNAASGGVLTSLLIYLLKEKIIDGAIVVKQGLPKPWLAEPIIATTIEEIIDCAQSVYAPIPVNVIFNDVKKFKGNLAFIGLPDQISSLRYLQNQDIEWVKKIKYIFGPYVGTNMYTESIKSFINTHGYKNMEDIKKLKYRDGEWPGYLKITMNDGNILKSEKFYYNYLIPFYITKSSLLSVDFSNELTDISVGDAWHPKYESLGQGYSVIIARTEKGNKILKMMEASNIIKLDQIEHSDAINMHGHMIDFKKRGSFIRFFFRSLVGKKSPNFGYKPIKIPLMRFFIEFIISLIFYFSGFKAVKYIVRFIPVSIIGPFFNTLRIKWKAMSKSIKRKGLSEYSIVFKD